MVNFHAAFGHDFLQITVGNSISDIEKYSVEDHAFRILASFEVNRHGLIPALKYKGLRLTQLAKNAHVLKTLRQNPSVLEAVLNEAPQAEAPALILADATMAQSLGWDYVVPLLAGGLKRADLRKRGDDLRLACHRAVVASAIEAVRLAADLSRRSVLLKAVAPKLRAKGAGEAVQIFLTQDAVTPAALPLSDRAARRLCDRLVELGVVRELTGRGTFRLYGV